MEEPHPKWVVLFYLIDLSMREPPILGWLSFGSLRRWVVFLWFSFFTTPDEKIRHTHTHFTTVRNRITETDEFPPNKMARTSTLSKKTEPAVKGQVPGY